MRLVSALVSAGVVYALAAPAIASASPVPPQCFSVDGHRMMILQGHTACGTETTGRGSLAASTGLGGIGYARSHGGGALAAGVAGGTGASDGANGMPLALSLGAGSMAASYVRGGSMALAVAGPGSQALAKSAAKPGTWCVGQAALAWDPRSGHFCAATPFGHVG